MKKKLAAMLTKMALRLNPDAAVQAVVPVYEEYEAKAIGVGGEITKNDIRKFKRETGEKSTRKATKLLVDKTRKSNLDSIFATASGIIEEKIYKKEDSIIVESRLNVYVKKEDSAKE